MQVIRKNVEENWDITNGNFAKLFNIIIEYEKLHEGDQLLLQRTIIDPVLKATSGIGLVKGYDSSSYGESLVGSNPTQYNIFLYLL